MTDYTAKIAALKEYPTEVLQVAFGNLQKEWRMGGMPADRVEYLNAVEDEIERRHPEFYRRKK